MTPGRLAAFATLLVLGLSAAARAGQGGMPSADQMSGVPLPSPELQTGTVTVRVARGTLADSVADHPVALMAGGESLEARTDGEGRATFSGLPSGITVQASTVLDGATLASETFTIPASGGIRLVLASAALDGGDVEAARGAAVSGDVVLSPASRFVVEIADGSLEVFGLIGIVNPAQARVEPPAPVDFIAPEGATSLTVLEGTTASAGVRGDRIAVSGPFPPGETVLQFAYRLPYETGTVAFEQRVPAALQQTSILVRRWPGVTFESDQATAYREMAIEGRDYLVANGGGLPAGGAVTFRLGGLPHDPRWPRIVALGVASVLAVVFLWYGWSGGATDGATRREALADRRERLFAELTALCDTPTRRPRDPSRYAALVAELEDVCLALDEVGDPAALAS